MANSTTAPFLPDLNEEQQIFINTVGNIYLTREFRWPRFQWVEDTLERQNLSAQMLLASLPRHPSNNYGYTSPNWARTPGPDEAVFLTLAGLATIPLANAIVDNFLAFIDRLGTIRSTIQLDPFTSEKPRATMNEIVELRRPHFDVRQHLIEMCGREPATWLCERVNISEDNWSITLQPQLRRFAGVRTVDDYFRRLDEILVLPKSTTESEVRYQSPFTLVAAIDYFDVVWRVKFGNHLVVPPGVERSARLANDVSNFEEFDSCICALAELLKNIRVPGSAGKGGHPLERLSPFLGEHLPQESHVRVEKAVGILDTARQLRHASQHHSDNLDPPRLWARLGINYPVFDWPSAWKQIQELATGAIDSIRSEIQASLDDEADK